MFSLTCVCIQVVSGTVLLYLNCYWTLCLSNLFTDLLKNVGCLFKVNIFNCCVYIEAGVSQHIESCVNRDAYCMFDFRVLRLKLRLKETKTCT